MHIQFTKENWKKLKEKYDAKKERGLEPLPMEQWLPIFVNGVLDKWFNNPKWNSTWEKAISEIDSNSYKAKEKTNVI